MISQPPATTSAAAGEAKGTVRFLGTFMADPPDVPWLVVVFVAAGLGISDPLCVKDYGSRPMTVYEHQSGIFCDR